MTTYTFIHLHDRIFDVYTGAEYRGQFALVGDTKREKAQSFLCMEGADFIVCKGPQNVIVVLLED